MNSQGIRTFKYFTKKYEKPVYSLKSINLYLAISTYDIFYFLCILNIDFKFSEMCKMFNF